MEINWRNIAEGAYAKYAETLNCEIEPFNELDADDQRAWIAAVRYACDLFGRAVTA